MPTLRQLVPMLSSDQDGEVLATVRAIGRMLKKEGSDWHQLAARLDNPIPSMQPRQRPRATWDELDGWQIAEALLKAGAGRLSEWEAEFLSDMTCWDGPATERQDAVLRRIANKLGWRP